MTSIKRRHNNEFVTVTIPMTVRAKGVDHSPFEGVKVYAFDGTNYKGYSPGQ